MSTQITILSITANTPVDIYYSAATGSTLVVSGQSSFPYVFTIPSPVDQSDYVVECIDGQGCIIEQIFNITPTPTPSVTATPTITPTPTLTTTPTTSITPTITPTTTVTPTITSSITPTPTPTPVIATHKKGQNYFTSTVDACNDQISLQNLYTYISQSNLTPVLGATLYTTVINGTLYVPFNGGGYYYLMQWANATYYAVQINNFGEILDFTIC